MWVRIFAASLAFQQALSGVFSGALVPLLLCLSIIYAMYIMSHEAQIMRRDLIERKNANVSMYESRAGCWGICVYMGMRVRVSMSHVCRFLSSQISKTPTTVNLSPIRKDIPPKTTPP